MAKKRINISIDPDLHEDAKVLAKKHHKTDVSGLISQLIVADLERTGVGSIVSEEDQAEWKSSRRSVADEEIGKLRRGARPKRVKKGVGTGRTKSRT